MSASNGDQPGPHVPAAGREQEHRGQPPAKISDIQLTFSTRRPVASDGSRGIERWTVEAVVAGPDTRDQHPTSQRVGEFQVFIIDLLRCRDPWGALDGSNDDLAHIGEIVFDMNTGQLAERLDTWLDRLGHRVLILDRVALEPEWQGHNLAALLVAESLDQLRTGCRVALCLPGPLNRPQDVTDEEYENSVRRMRRVWSQLGFRPFEEGVWLLEPNRRTLDDSLATLRARHRLTMSV